MDLCDFPVFKGLNPTQTRNFTSACTTQDYSAGTPIITKGGLGDTLLVG